MIKKRLKQITVASLTLLVVGYGVFAMRHFSKQHGTAVCHAVEVVLADKNNDLLITKEYIQNMVVNSGYNPVGKRVDSIDVEAIEVYVEKNKMVRDAEVYLTNSGKLKVKVAQRIPLYRVMGEGGNFFVDYDGVMLPMQSLYPVKLPIVTGTIEKEFAANELREFVLYLQDNPFWAQQIDQICVRGREVELIPKVGNHRILMGTLTDVNKKLNRLKKFYREGLNEVGWNRYSVISLKYDKQIVCTKR